jgi:hypothetical protein
MVWFFFFCVNKQMNSHLRLHTAAAAAAAAAAAVSELELLVPRGPGGGAMDQLRPEPAAGAHEIEKTAAPDVESEPAAAVPEPERVPPWREQVTARGMVAALLIGFVYTVIVMKLSLTTGLTPTMNVSAALLAFLALRGWTRALGRLGIACRPFTRQENTVVQTCVVACYTIGFGGKPVRHALLANRRALSQSRVRPPSLLTILPIRRWVRVVPAGPGQEDVRALRGEHAGQRAGELQGACHRLDDRIPPRRQLRGAPHLASTQKGPVPPAVLSSL